MIKLVIFDLDQTLVNTQIFDKQIINGELRNISSKIPFMRVFDEVYEVLSYLKDNQIKISVITDMYGVYAKKILDYFKIEADFLVSYYDVIKQKPDSESINTTLRYFKLIDKNEVLYVGDRNIDIVTARNAKVKSVGAFWGNEDNIELTNSKPDYCIKKPLDLISVINNCNQIMHSNLKKLYSNKMYLDVIKNINSGMVVEYKCPSNISLLYCWSLYNYYLKKPNFVICFNSDELFIAINSILINLNENNLLLELTLKKEKILKQYLVNNELPIELMNIRELYFDNKFNEIVNILNIDRNDRYIPPEKFINYYCWSLFNLYLKGSDFINSSSINDIQFSIRSICFLKSDEDKVYRLALSKERYFEYTQKGLNISKKGEYKYSNKKSRNLSYTNGEEDFEFLKNEARRSFEYENREYEIDEYPEINKDYDNYNTLDVDDNESFRKYKEFLKNK